MRISPLALELATRVVLGAAGDEGYAWLRAALWRWLRSDGVESLSSMLHLGDSPRRVRLLVRDSWLRDAATYVAGASPWERARELEREVGHFLAFKWPAWRENDEPPAHATPVERCLFVARLADELPRSAPRIYSILTSQFGETAK